MTVGELPRSSTSEGGGEGPRHGGRALVTALFAVYLALLVWIVMWKLELHSFGTGELRQVKLVPFVSSACNGASAPSEVVANVVLFIPFGVYLGLLAPAWPWWKATIAIAGASLALEVAQYALAVGSSDVTDLITNTAGGLAGLGVLALVRRRLGARTVTVMTRACAGLTVLALLSTALVVSSPLRFAPPRDAAASSHGAPGAIPGTNSGERERMHRETRDPRC